MADSTKHIPHDPDQNQPVRPEDDAGPEPKKEGVRTPDPDAKIAAAEREGGTGRYTSREKADPELEAEQREADRRTAEDLGRDGDDEEAA